MKPQDEVSCYKKHSKIGWSLMPILGIILVLVILAVKYPDWSITGLGIFDIQKYEPEKQEVYTFNEVYNEIKAIDKIYGTDYHSESLVRNRVAADYLLPMIDDITKLYNAINTSSHTDETRWILKFVEARRGWLEAQVYLEKALKFGKSGIVTTKFSCKDNETVLLATYYYNQTLGLFHDAENNLDEALFNIKEAQNIVGTNEQKPKIYDSPEAGQIAKAINTNIYIIDTRCRGIKEKIPENSTIFIAARKVQ